MRCVLIALPEERHLPDDRLHDRRQKHLPATAAFDWTSTIHTSSTRAAATLTASLLGTINSAHAPPHRSRLTLSHIPYLLPRSQELVKKLSRGANDCGFRSWRARLGGGALLVPQGRALRQGRGAHLEGYATGRARVRAFLRASDAAGCALVRTACARCPSHMGMVLVSWSTVAWSSSSTRGVRFAVRGGCSGDGRATQCAIGVRCDSAIGNVLSGSRTRVCRELSGCFEVVLIGLTDVLSGDISGLMRFGRYRTPYPRLPAPPQPGVETRET